MADLKENVVFDKSIIISNKEGSSQTEYGAAGQLRFNQSSLKFEGYHSYPDKSGADIFGNNWRSLTQNVASASELGIIRVGTNLNIQASTGILSSVAAGVSRIYQLVITISPIIGAADYQSINEAIAHAIGSPTDSPPYTNGSITSSINSAPSPIYPFVIQLGPGQYTESLNTIVLPDYVSLRGEDNYNSMIIQNSGSNISIQSGSMVTLGQNCEIKNLVIQLADSHSSLYSNAIYSYNKSNVSIDSCIITCSNTINTTQETYGIYMNGGEKNTITNNNIIFNSSILSCIFCTTINITHTTPKISNNNIEILAPYSLNIKGVNIDTCIGTESISDKVYIENLTVSINYYTTVSGSFNNGIYILNSPVIINNSDIEVSNTLLSNYGIVFQYSNNIGKPYSGTTTSNVISFTTTNSNYVTVNTINSSNISSLNFLTENYQSGQYISVSGSSSNDGIYKIVSIPSSNVIILDNGYNLVNESISLLNTITLKGLFEIDISNSKINASTNTILNNSPSNTNYIVNLNNVINEGSLAQIKPSFVFYTNYKTITVGIVNCDFNSLSNAMNSITDNSYNTRYLIKIQSGIYYENRFIICLQYVDIEGNGEDNTILQFNQTDNSSGIPNNNTSCFLLCSNISIKNLTIKNVNRSPPYSPPSPPPSPTTATTTVLYNNPIPNPLTNPISNIILENVVINSTCNSAYNTGIYLENASAITLRNVNIIVNSTIPSTLNTGIYTKTSSNCNFYNISTTVNSGNSITNTSINLIDSECNLYNCNLNTNSGTSTNIGIKTNNINNTQKLVQIYNGQIRAYINIDYSIYADNYYTVFCNSVQLLGETFANSIYSRIVCNSCYTFLNENDKLQLQTLSSRGENEQILNTITLGDSAGNRNATGTDNTFIGVNAGKYVTTAAYNTAIGSNTGKILTTAKNNTLLGSYAGLSISEGMRNTIVGSNAAINISTGNENVIGGYVAGHNLVLGNYNVITGTRAGYSLETGNLNVFVGQEAGYNTLIAQQNTFIGGNSGISNTTGNNNTYLGYNSGYNTLTGNNNVLIGKESGYTNLSSNIVAIGTSAGYNNTNSIKNTYVGNNSGYNNGTGDCNTYLGYSAGSSNTAALVSGSGSGSFNIAIGNEAGYSLTTGSRNVLIGSTKNVDGLSNDAAGWSLQNGTDNIHIGANTGSLATSAINNVLIGSDIGGSITTAGNNVLIGKNTGNSILETGGNIIIGSGSGNDNADGNALIIGQNSAVGYSGNAAFVLGNNAGKNVQGDYNMFVGQNSGGSSQTKTGNYNLAIGAYSGNFLSTGSRNVIVGTGDNLNSAGRVITSGSDNTILGYSAGSAIQTGIGNTIIGSNSGAYLTNGTNNLILGYSSAFNLSSGSNNVSLGPESGYNLNLGSGNIFSGYQAGYQTTSGSNNINIGYQTGYQGTTSINNIHIGYQTGYKSKANNNLFLGYQAGYQNTTGVNNIFIGKNSGSGSNNNNRQIGDSNIFLGTNTGATNDQGARNIFLGINAGQYNTNGSKNIFIGENTGLNSIISRNIFIGTSIDDSKGVGYNSQAQITVDPAYTGDKNLFIGHDVGIENTTGHGNIFLGDSAGNQNTGGAQNIYIGTNAGQSANEDTANFNIAIGYNSGTANLIGQENILIGKDTGLNLNESNQIFIGTEAGSSATNGINNIFIGYLSGAGIDTQSNNVVLGYSALSSGQCNNSVMIGTYAGSTNNGDENVFIGNVSGIFNTVGMNNTFIGSATGATNTIGMQNIFMGTSSGINNDQGSNNTFMGYQSGFQNINGAANLYIGYQSGFSNQNGNDNICLGYLAGGSNKNSNNTFIGYSTGYLNEEGLGNTFIGYKTGYNNINSSVNTYIGNLVGQLNDGNNNFFLGYEANEDIYNAGLLTNYNNKFAIYRNTQSGITSNTTANCTILVGGDFSSGRLGVGTLVPEAWLTTSLSAYTDTKLVVLGKIRAESHTTFTGAHNVTINIENINNQNDTILEGFIMSATGTTKKTGISDTIVTVKPSNIANDKAVYGVYSGCEKVVVNYVSTTIYYVNALGEGCVLISNYGGEIQNGDYITTCPITGYGSLQSDDIMHSYTVAKCTENIDWSLINETISYNGNIYKTYLASCTYHCG